MNILFITSVDDILTPEKPLRTPEEMQFGISYISSLLKNNNHDTRLVVLSRMLGDRNYVNVDSIIRVFSPDAIFFTAVASEYRFIADVAKYCRAHYPGIYQVAGGAHISLNPQSCIVDTFDAICIGEGEYPSLELVTQLSSGKRPSGISNMWIKGNGSVQKNPPRPFIEDIDSLPFPDRQMWRGWIIDTPAQRQPVLLGRGCPYNCTYCCNHALRRLASGSYLRFRSPGSIVNEISSLLKTYPGTKDFYLEVETIAANLDWATKLCSMLKDLNAVHGNMLTFGTNLRVMPGADLDRLFSAFRSAGFTFIRIGVESGSERVRRDILKREYSNEDIKNTVRLAKKYGMSISSYNLIGVPGETLSDFRETIKLNRECQPDSVYAHIFFPYPGTELYNTCDKLGLLEGISDTALERCRATLDLPGFSKRQIQDGFIWFDYDVYKRKRPLHRLLAKVFVSKCRSIPILHYLYRKITYLPPYRWIRAFFGAFDKLPN